MLMLARLMILISKNEERARWMDSEVGWKLAELLGSKCDVQQHKVQFMANYCGVPQRSILWPPFNIFLSGLDNRTQRPFCRSADDRELGGVAGVPNGYVAIKGTVTGWRNGLMGCLWSLTMRSAMSCSGENSVHQNKVNWVAGEKALTGRLCVPPVPKQELSWNLCYDQPAAWSQLCFSKGASNLPKAWLEAAPVQNVPCNAFQSLCLQRLWYRTGTLRSGGN